MLVRPLRPGRKNSVAVFTVFVALSAAGLAQPHGSPRNRHTGTPGASAAREEDGGAAAPGTPFDFYLLALTLHPAFCADGHEREAECRAASPPVSIHGLWPERLQPGRYPHDCAGPPLALEKDLERRLAQLMPGMAGGLHRHEWRKHGTCSGLDDDVYYALAYARARDVERALGGKLTSLAGRDTSAAELRGYADGRSPGMGATLTFHCRTLRGAPAAHRREPYLVEIRQCLSKGTGPGGGGAPIGCASVQRRDQGCGGRFNVAGPR